MSRTALLAIAVTVSLFCSACGNAPLTINNFDVSKAFRVVQNTKEATVDLSEEQEISLGQGIASNLLGVAPLLPNQNVQRYVNGVGRWLSLQTERPDLPWTFAVLDDDSINAFAAPGGYILITKGLLLRMKSEAELAGVLAHELAHVLMKHHLRAIKKSAGMNLAKDAMSYVAEAKGVNPALTKMASAGTELYTRGLDKEDEFEADRMGVVIAARAGYEPYGLPAVLLSLQAVNPQAASLALMFKSHPPLSERLTLLEASMGNAYERFENQPNLAARFHAQLAQILPEKKTVTTPDKKIKK